MTPIVSIRVIPCSDPECADGFILVHNAYSPTPLKPEKQRCDICGGKGYLVLESTTKD